MTRFLEAVTFLTRVPISRGEATGNIGKASAWFPLVGGLVGLAVAGVYAALYPWLPSLLTAVIAIAVGSWLTGALHEDGLADTFDAFGSGASGDDALRIMRDSRLGTYGTTAVVVTVLWRTVAVGSLGPAAALAGVVTAHSLGRAGSVALMAVAPPAREDGLGRSGLSGVTRGGTWFAVLTGLAVSSVAAGWWVGPAVVAVTLCVVALRTISSRRIGGITGDVLGACQQVSEMLILAIFAAAVWQGWHPWWA